MERDKNIVILGTGGTIAGVAEQAGTSVGYRAALLGVAQLLQAVPDLSALRRRRCRRSNWRSWTARTWIMQPGMRSRCAVRSCSGVMMWAAW